MTALRCAVAALALVGAACNGSNGAPAEASADASADVGGDECPPGVPCDCTYVDGAYSGCGADGGLPACAADGSAANGVAGLVCSSAGATCFDCSEGAGLWCYCAYAGTGSDAGVQWQCLGAGHACKGP
jgi:hypothetical protein